MANKRLEKSPRNLAEIMFYLSLDPCPACGYLGAVGETKETILRAEPDEPSEKLFIAICPRCADERGVIYSSEGMDDWLATLGELGGASPSRIISPPRFLAELRRLDDLVPPDPTMASHTEYFAALSAAHRCWKCSKELLKFLGPGDDEVPPQHFWSDDDHAARNADPSAYRRTYLERLLETCHRQLDRYRAERPRYEALKAAHEAANPPPRPPAFSKASLEAHRLWARSPEKGPVVGQQLVAEDVAQPGARLGAQDLSGSIVTRADLTGADLSSADVHAVRWTDVDLSKARLGSALLHSSKLVRCRFTSAGLGLVSLGDSILEDCDFSGADLNRSTWFRSDVARCRFDGARVGDARLDHAVVVDCSFRGASFATTFDKVYGTAARAWFIRCDLRDVDWTGRWFYNTVFVDCLFAGGHGTPHGFQDIHLIRCALEPGGPPVGVADLAALLAIPPEHIIDLPDKQPRANERPYTRHGVDAKGPYIDYVQEHSPLLLAERARDPRAPFPVPFKTP